MRAVGVEDMIIVDGWNRANSDGLQLRPGNGDAPQGASSIEDEGITLQSPVRCLEQELTSSRGYQLINDCPGEHERAGGLVGGSM